MREDRAIWKTSLIFVKGDRFLRVLREVKHLCHPHATLPCALQQAEKSLKNPMLPHLPPNYSQDGHSVGRTLDDSPARGRYGSAWSAGVRARVLAVALTQATFSYPWTGHGTRSGLQQCPGCKHPFATYIYSQGCPR